MPSREDVCYFGAGPAGIPTEVAKAAAEAFVNFENTGIGLAEMSHRSSKATQILNDTKANLRKLLEVPSSHEIIFCHGGGSGEFSATVYNLVPIWVEKRRRIAERELGAENEEAIVERVRKEVREKLRLDYLITGSWSNKASQEAANLLGPVGGKNLINIATDARKSNDGKFIDIPPESTWNLTDPKTNGGCGSAFVYYCDNETVDGIEFPHFPTILEPNPGAAPEDEKIVVCDMSSNILSRPVPVSKYGVIYAGAQKNIGITDTTIVIVRSDLLTTVPPPAFLHAVGIWSPPVILNWATIEKNNSLYNTMPIFSLYTANLVLTRLLTLYPSSTSSPNKSALSSQSEASNTKATTLYDILDRHSPAIYAVVPKAGVRSRMNLCFRVKGGDAQAESLWLKGAEERGLLGLKGHRSVGGVRISSYNVVTQEDVGKLAEWLEEFAKVNGGA